MMKVKCWELEKCEKTECPVYEKENERCWLVSGTHCRDEIQGMFLNKIEICLKCAVFKNNVGPREEEWLRTLDFADRQFKEYVKTIDKQKESILQLSTPVIPIWNRILVLPLIGILDEDRARKMIDNLLEKISITQSKVAIVDVTGVSEVDSSVAKHLLRISQSAHLIGCKCIFTGINPYNAQILITAGVDLSGIATRPALQNGLELAFELTNVRMVNDNKLHTGGA